MTNSIAIKNSSSTFTWKKDAGKLLFWVAFGFVILCQIVLHILSVVGVKFPLAPDNLYVIGASILMIWHGTITKGWKRTLTGFIALLLVGFLMEGLGVNFGLVYGPYHYDDALGPRSFGVPYTVPLSWELNMYPAFYLALYLIPSNLKSKISKWWQKWAYVVLLAGVSALICTAYDMIADPIYCGIPKAWIWYNPSDYMIFVHGGIPLTNYFGWILTGFTGSLVYFLIVNSTPKEEHVKSNYLILWFPLVIYSGAMVMPVLLNALVVHSQAIWLETIMGMGFVILIILEKYYSKKLGFVDAGVENPE